MIRVGDFIEGALGTPLENVAGHVPWEWTRNAAAIVTRLLAGIGGGYRRDGEAAVHVRAHVEPGALIRGPAIIGPDCFVAASALLRGGCWLEARCAVGPCVELKSSFVFADTRLAHLCFVGDSVLGRDVNLEAGAVIANCRNEWTEKRIGFSHAGHWIDTGVEKFGALVGDGARIGANAVIAPGAVLARGQVVPRLGLVDQGSREV